jgi:hypothetical protein
MGYEEGVDAARELLHRPAMLLIVETASPAFFSSSSRRSYSSPERLLCFLLRSFIPLPPHHRLKHLASLAVEVGAGTTVSAPLADPADVAISMRSAERTGD